MQQTDHRATPCPSVNSLRITPRVRANYFAWMGLAQRLQCKLQDGLLNGGLTVASGCGPTLSKLVFRPGSSNRYSARPWLFLSERSGGA